MAITIHIFYTGSNGSARAFIDEMIASGTVAKIRGEAGNLRYEYFLPVDDPQTVLLIDSWENQTALDRHHASAMMEIITALRIKYDLHMRVERYVSEGDETVERDAAFIRK